MMPQHNLCLFKRAQKRLDGELVFGNQISVGFPQRLGTRKDSLPSSGHSEGLVAMEMPHVGVTSNNIGRQLSTIYPQNLSGTWQTCGNLEMQNSRAFGNGQKPKGNNSIHAKGRSGTGCRNGAANGRENIPGWMSDGPQTNYSDCGSNWENKPNGQLNRSLNGKSDSDNADKVDTIMKRSRVTSPKPARYSFDSLKYTGRNSPGVYVGRKCRTPSPYTGAGMGAPPALAAPGAPSQQTSSAFTRKVSPYQVELPDNDKYFNPISSTSSSSNQASNPVELHVSNLDQDIEPNFMKKILMSIFGEHVMVLHVSVYMQSDGNFAASLKVPSLQDAQYAISQLHRRKVGFKRISISYANSSHPHNTQFIRWQIVSLLQEVPGYKLPLFKFLELFESRYLMTVSVSDLCKLRDVCVITSENNGRMVALNPDHRNTPSPNVVSCQDIDLYCSLHYKGIQASNKGWAELEAAQLPNVRETLTNFSSNVHCLLTSHNNILPLASFCDCYEHQFGSLNVDESGVALEHLITCVSKVELAVSNGIKYLKPAPLRTPSDEKLEEGCKSASPSLANQVNQFGRELVDLLKTQPKCQLMFNRFIPAYHHHFGRQCRVADYGFTKLIELLEALPIVRVIGEAKKRIVTLSFHAQIRRFTSDLLRVLKAQPFKKMTLDELPQSFERILGRVFDPVDYGLCTLTDLVDQLSENTVVVTRTSNNISLSLSKHEQTSEEIQLTKVFAKEVVELLSHASQCSILFNNFIPAYHHNYGHQCRVADFGFSKLIELFEAIPDVVTLDENSEGERRVTLTCELKLKVLNDQIFKLASARYPPGLPLKSLSAAFLWQYGYTLKPENYQANSLEELISTITTVKVENLDCGPTLIPVDEAQVKQVSAQVRQILMNSEEGRLPLSKLQAAFGKCYQRHLTAEQLMTNMPDIIKIEEPKGGEKLVSLNRLNQFAREIYQILLKRNGCKLPLKLLESAYTQEYFVPVHPEMYGFTSFTALLCAIAHTVTIRGKGIKRIVFLNRDLINGSNVGVSPSQNRAAGVGMPNDDAFLDDLVNGSPKKTNESVWSNGCHLEGYDNQVPMVILPKMSSPPANIMSQTALISPCKTLLGATGSHPLLYTPTSAGGPPLVSAPDPSELPLPEMYLSSPKINKEEDSYRKSSMNNESETGIPGTNKVVSGSKSDSNSVQPKQTAGANNAVDPALKRKLRLAAQFQTPIDLL